MTLHHSDAWLDIYQGDVRDVLPSLAADSVDCIVTSPPYWGLRDYGTAAWSGGAIDHEHVGVDLRTADVGGSKQQTKRGSIGVRSGDCECGAVRQDAQLGLERTPEEYVASLVAVFRELRRVLKPAGTCWLNLGDSFAGSSTGADRPPEPGHTREDNGRVKTGQEGKHKRPSGHGLKPKDLVGIPWRVAFALQADGWYLRSDIIWAKPNPMPESVTDRPTKAHEYLFLLTRSARYYFDADAVREPNVRQWNESNVGAANWVNNPAMRQEKLRNGDNEGGGHYGLADTLPNPAGRNLRSVWTIATRPYPGAHFAVFPPELPERCIKAGSSERGVCPECGAPWERVVERSSNWQDRKAAGAAAGSLVNGHNASHGAGMSHDLGGGPVIDLGWRPACRCAHESAGWVPQPAVVLDPFAGSGTVGLVANRLSRRAILIDLNGDYLKQQLQRNAQTPLGLVAR